MLDEVAQLNTSQFAIYENPFSFYFIFIFQFMLRYLGHQLMPWSMLTLTKEFIREIKKVTQNEKKNTSSILVFSIQIIGKF